MKRLVAPSWRTALALACVFLLASAVELGARGRGGGGFSRGGGGGGFSRGGGYSRAGAARSGSIGGYERSRAGYGSYGGSRGGYGSYGDSGRSSGYGSSTRPSTRTRPADAGSRDGSFETRRGETVDWDSSVTRTEEGFERESSWQSTSGASGSGSSSVRVEDGQIQSAERSRHAENAQGETMDREISSQRHGDQIEREGRVETSTGKHAESEGVITKTDDGFIAQGAVWGDDRAAAGTIVKDGDDVYARGAARDGDEVTWGRAHCHDGRCTGGRVTADLDDYYYEPYYYYPYYYGWYSCPAGSVQTWHSSYGTPIYGCRDVTVVHTTISLGPSSTGSAASAAAAPREAQVTSAPVLMYEISPEVVVYATSYEPEGVYALKQGERFFWAPGPKDASADAKGWIVQAGAMPAPTANATVITYAIGTRTVYLTNERPAPGFYAEPSNQLFAWLPGVREPSDEERDAIRTAISAQRAGGQAALDREARKLEADREPPPASDSKPAS